jgi:pimeloyl-ACP methyl ester carboxylesterase
VPTAPHGPVELHYDTFGSSDDPTLLLVNGLGSQSINYAVRWCEMFAARGHQVVRFDNRDTGLSSKLDGVDYDLADMAGDAVAILDHLGIDRAHVMGLSMGGMIVQRLTIDHPERLLSMTSVMSTTGELEYGQPSPEAMASLMSPPANSRDEYLDNHVAAVGVYGSDPAWIDEADIRARAGAAYDRCFCPAGVGRQMLAVRRDGSRADGLRSLAVPTLVLHGSRDTLIHPSGGRRTAELVPDAVYVEIDGMGHDYPPTVWDRWVSTWADFVASLPAG